MKRRIYGFNFGEFEFIGFPIDRYEEYPWNNEKERIKFYRNLIEDNTDQSREKAKLFIKKESKEKMHVNLSRSFIFRITWIVLFFIFLISPINTLIGLFSFIICVIGFQTASFITKKRAISEYVAYLSTDIMVDAIFDLEKEIQDIKNE